MFLMISPFWSFDPFIFSVSLLIYQFILFLSFPLSYSFYPTYWRAGIRLLKKEVLILFPVINFYSLGASHFLISLFFIMSIINLSSLFNFIFSPLAHVMLAVSGSLCFWLSTMIYQALFFLKDKLIHLTPKGTPMWLIFFMVLIEVISQLIRPITLGVRLAANLTAGHLILSLLSGVGGWVSFFLQLPLFLLEILVSIVQPFVFCLLVFLYFLER